MSAGYRISDKMTFFIYGRIGLGDVVIILFISSKVSDLIRYSRIFGITLIYYTIRRLDKSVFIDTRI